MRPKRGILVAGKRLFHFPHPARGATARYLQGLEQADFNSHTPLGATAEISRLWAHGFTFQLAHPRGARLAAHPKPLIHLNFNSPHPMRNATRVGQNRIARCVFQLTQPVRYATYLLCHLILIVSFQLPNPSGVRPISDEGTLYSVSTPVPRDGATTYLYRYTLPTRHFNSCISYEVRPATGAGGNTPRVLHMQSATSSHQSCPGSPFDFNSRSPCGVRHTAWSGWQTLPHFNSRIP